MVGIEEPDGITVGIVWGGSGASAPLPVPVGRPRMREPPTPVGSAGLLTRVVVCGLLGGRVE